MTDWLIKELIKGILQMLLLLLISWLHFLASCSWLCHHLVTVFSCLWNGRECPSSTPNNSLFCDFTFFSHKVKSLAYLSTTTLFTLCFYASLCLLFDWLWLFLSALVLRLSFSALVLLALDIFLCLYHLAFCLALVVSTIVFHVLFVSLL